MNTISVSEENLVSWKRKVCVHEKVWNKEGMDVSVFYSLRNIWLESFIKELNNDFEYLEKSLGNYNILKKN